MQDIAGKKLLFLGGSMLDRHAMRIAKSMGVKTIIANYYSTDRSPAKLEADQSFDVNNTDESIMKSLIRDEHVDGIFGGYTDSNLPNYQKLCELAGLPCYGTKRQFEITTDKAFFKEMCHKHGVLTVEEFDSESITENSEINYPLFVKPVDSSGCRGCSSCYDYKEYCDSLKLALDYSPSKTVTVEKYYDYNIYGDFMACYSMRNGVVTLATLGDRVLYSGEGNVAPLPIQLMYPSRYINEYIGSTNKKVVKMLEEEGFMNGTLFMQGFTDGKEFRFFEMGYRQNGSQQFVLTDYFNHNNALIEAIRFALTGEVNEQASERDDPHFASPACNLVIYLKPGVIKEVKGIDEVLKMPEVINYTPWLEAGGTVGAQGTLGQSLLRFHVVGKNEEHLNELIKTIRRTVDAIDTDGNSMIVEF